MRQSQQKSPSKPTPAVETDKLAVKIGRLSKMIDVSRGTIYNLIRRGELRTIKVGSELRVPMSEVRRFLGDAEQGNPQSAIVEENP